MGAQKKQKDTHMVIAVAFFNVNMFCVCVTAVRHLFEVEIWGLYSILGVFQSDAIFKPQEGQTHLIDSWVLNWTNQRHAKLLFTRFKNKEKTYIQ